ncbi:MAG: flagellar protein FlgN [Desulfobacca sp.]|nr:flagellar protein FlgN [Desulfobacca sp.]
MSNHDPESTRPDQVALQTWISQETALYEELLDCLEQEQRHLLKLEIEELFKTVRVKESLLQRLLAAREKRRDFLNRLAASPTGGTPGLPGLESLINQQRRRLASLTKRISQVNLQNRTLIQDGLDIIQEFIDLASGAQNNPRTYQRQGILDHATGSAGFNRQV